MGVAIIFIYFIFLNCHVFPIIDDEHSSTGRQCTYACEEINHKKLHAELIPDIILDNVKQKYKSINT